MNRSIDALYGVFIPYREVKSSEKRVNILIGVLGAIWVLNLFDSAVFEPAPVFQEDGCNRDACAGRCFDVQAGHAEGAISHHVETEFVGVGEFGADHLRHMLCKDLALLS